MASNPTDSSRLDQHYAEFKRLVGEAQRHSSAGHWPRAATAAQIAATYAWLNPGGIFACAGLERLLAELGSQLHPAPLSAIRNPPAKLVGSETPGAVLHVITQAYQTGGPTQFVSCWLDQDHRRLHRVCLTRQGATPIPDKLTCRIGERVEVTRIDQVAGGIMGRAAALRQMAAQFDMVLVHSHPNDVIPVIALSDAAGLPPIVYVNHGDHVFWIGTSIAQTLMNLRRSGAELAAERRGIERARSTIAPRPLSIRRRTMSRSEAKRLVGVDQDAVLIVTAADEAKYRPLNPPSLLDMMLPVILGNPNSVMRAAGPTDTGEWAAAAASTDNRIKALGRIDDVATLHQAADIYIDSYPFSSLTSLLEAGSMGTCVVTYRGHPDSCAVLGADTIGIDGWMLRPTDPDELRRTLEQLVTDADLRRRWGAGIDHAITRTHTGVGWLDSVEGLYRFANGNHGHVQIGETQRRTDLLDQLVDLVMAQTPYSLGAPGAIAANLGLMPGIERLLAALRLLCLGQPVRARDLLPERVLPGLAKLWRALQLH